MASKKTTLSILNDTSIMPEAVASGVLDEACQLLEITPEDLGTDIFGYLIGYAEAVYSNNANFRKKVRSNANHGNAGRDYLYSYMRHWLSSEIIRRNPRYRHVLESSGFSMGGETR